MLARDLPRVTPLVLLAAAGLARAQCSGQQLLAGDPQANAYNGYAVAMDGPYVLTTALGKTVGGLTDAGEVYAYAPFGNAWGQVTHITAPNPVVGDYFGSAVALGGGAQWAVIGARGYVGFSGKAFIFKRDLNTNLWNLAANLGSGSSGAALGSSVAMNSQGTIAVVGAPAATVTDLFSSTFAAGQALVYVRSGNTWTYQFDLHQYEASIRHSNDGYGYAVACDGNTVVTGVLSGGDAAHAGDGYIHIWTQNGTQWTATGEVYAPDASWNASFGSSVGLSGGVLVVGARNATYQGMNSAGCAYIYRFVNGAWTYDSTLHASDAAAGDMFGAVASAYGDTVVIGTYTAAQKAYVFRRTASNQWVQDARYTSPGGAAADEFAAGVAIGSSGLVVGADAYDTPNFANAGTAYVYNLPGPGSDSCAGATPVGQGSVSGCTDHCTVDGASICGTGSPVGPDTWFSYTAPATGPLSIDTQGSALDTILSVHTGCPGNEANAIVCNDDFAPPQRWSKVTFNVVQGQTYLIRIAGYGNATGSFTLNIGPVGGCYANCDGSTTTPVLNVLDFSCFLNKFAAGDPYANCDNSTNPPVLNVLDFSCFLNKFAAGCT